MPRNYVKKKDGPNYSLEDIKHAVEDVVTRKRTYRNASDYYGVPTSVIFHRINGRHVGLDRMGAGVSKALPDNVEQHIANCLQTRARLGYPCHKEELKKLVGQYVTECEIKTPFKDNIPGDDWYQNFMKRHPNLSLKKPELLQKVRADARKPYVVYHFYELLATAVKEANLANKPMFIFNTDETGFNNDPCKTRAIGEKGVALSRVSGGSGRESTTVLGCISADGAYMPPLIIFKGAAVQPRWVSDEAFPGTLYGATKKGWMKEPVFFHWITTGFIPFVNEVRKKYNEPNQQVLLVYDGHASHFSVRIVEAATSANIILVKFPSHLTDRIQPLDKCVFGPVKIIWDKMLVDYGVQQMGKGSGRLSKEKFAEILGQVWKKALTEKNIISGFATTGVFPVDAAKFPKKMFNQEELKQYENLIAAVAIETEPSDYSNENAHNEDIASPSLCKTLTPQEQQISSNIDNDNNITSLERPNIPVDSAKETPKQSPFQSPSLLRELSPMPETQLAFGNVTSDNVPDSFSQNSKKLSEHRTVATSIQEIENVNFERDVQKQNVICQGMQMESNKNPPKYESNHQNAEPSTLINKIMKMISLDVNTSFETKAKILSAITLTCNTNSQTSDVRDSVSPNKQALQKIFGVQAKSPQKIKKIVVPRLKQAAFGEILTSEEVKKRLKLAQEKKAMPKIKQKKLQTKEKEKKIKLNNKENLELNKIVNITPPSHSDVSTKASDTAKNENKRPKKLTKKRTELNKADTIQKSKKNTNKTH